MEKSEIKAYLLSLSETDRKVLLKELTIEMSEKPPLELLNRRELYDNKIGGCPHCDGKKYRKHGIDKSVQRYFCTICEKTFTEHTGTWLAGLHHKDLVEDYLKLMGEECSLDKIKVKLNINKKTAFDWRHKILASTASVEETAFTGITESDETFFAESQKGSQNMTRSARKRGKSIKKRGINEQQVAVIATADRSSELNLTLATLGRIKKIDIENAIGKFISPQVILCTDSHVSFKGFAIDNKLTHIKLRSDLKQFVKGVYHIQHVNSIHSRLKIWIEATFQGVSTKYLQNYLNWFRLKEKLKNSQNFLVEFMRKTLIDSHALEKYRLIPQKYEELMNLKR